MMPQWGQAQCILHQCPAPSVNCFNNNAFKRATRPQTEGEVIFIYKRYKTSGNTENQSGMESLGAVTHAATEGRHCSTYEAASQPMCCMGRMTAVVVQQVKPM